MAPLPNPEPRFLTAEELLPLRGTPEFDAEIARQMKAMAEHDRRNNYADIWEPDWERLDKVWK